MSLIVTGSIGIDSIEAPTGKVVDVLGGSSVYFAAAASFFGPIRLVGAVGDDFPEGFLDTFRHFDVDVQGLEKRAGSKTFRWSGRYHENMNRRDTLDVQLNVLAEKLPPVPPCFHDSAYIFLANTHPSGQLELLDQFPHRKLVVADTMDLWIENEKSLLLKLLKRIDALVLNDTEAQQLTGQPNLIKAAQQIIDMGPRFVVIKNGEHGSLLEHEDGRIALPAYPASAVVDPTGAGDSFAGGMMGYLAAKDEVSLSTLRQALAYGTIVASFNIESFSLDRLREIDRRVVDERFGAYCDMLRV